jgi:hypothetical protein
LSAARQGRAEMLYFRRVLAEFAVMPHPSCQHKRTRLIAEDDSAKYVECLDCGEILEAGELDDSTGFSESLSDA